MLTNDLRLLAALTAVLAGLGTLLLALAGLELLGAAADRLRLHSPAAARQARVRSALAGYQCLHAPRTTGIPRRNRR